MLDTEATIRRHLRIGLATMFLLGGTATAWSLIASIDSAVVTHGTVVVESNVKKVQHPTGGIVGAIHAKEGQRVTEGEVLLRLDDTATRAALGIVVNELTALRARVARLTAERDSSSEIAFPPDLLDRAANHSVVRDVLDGETRLYTAPPVPACAAPATL